MKFTILIVAILCGLLAYAGLYAKSNSNNNVPDFEPAGMCMLDISDWPCLDENGC